MKMPAGRLARLFPFLLWWPLVTRASLRDDLVAGLTGALIVLPQGVAFATIAGLPPEYGLYAAMLPAIVAALFGSSWHLVSGPTTAISIAIYGAVHHLAEPGTPQYVGLILTLTLQVGIFQVALGLARMGALVNFISHTVVIGFTTGAAVLIAASQIRNFFGVDLPRGLPFYEVLHQFAMRIDHVNPWVTGVGVATLAAGVAARRWWRKFPYMIAAMLAGSLVAFAINQFVGQTETGIRTVGALPAGLPPLSMPDISWAALKKTFGPALVITMLALTEALSIARAVAVRSEQRIDGNQEFIGQGLSNIAGAFFSGYASSGSFNRSGVNYEAGARTPLATIFASVFLLLILLVVAPLAAYLPHAAMGGILFMVAWGLIDFHHIRAIWQTSKPEAAVLWVTIIGTLLNLEAGIVAGVLLSLLLYLNRTSKPGIEPMVPVEDSGGYHFIAARGKAECPQLRVVRINGSAYFGAVDHIQSALQQIDVDNPRQKSVLVVSLGMNFIDVAGAEMFAQEARRRKRLGGGLYFYRMKDEAWRLLRQGNYVHEIGEGAFFPLKSKPTEALYWTLDPEVCRHCKSRIFAACHGGRLPDGDRRLRLLFAADADTDGIPTTVATGLARRLGVALDVVAMRGSNEDEDHFGERLSAVQRKAIAADVPTEFHRRQGKDLPSEIHRAAIDTDAQLLVVGRRSLAGTSGAGAAETRRIVAGAPCNVLLIPERGELWSRRILVAFDGSPAAHDAVGFALQIAKPMRLPLTLFSAADSASGLPAAIAGEAELALAAARLEGVAAEHLVRHGRIADSILAVAAERDADLIVLYRHARSRLGRTLTGSVSNEVLDRAAIPVLLCGGERQIGSDTG
ncbi:MAG: sulfate permease [Sulfuritalea sp.]|jgi:SulP family sulfate permease|nr:sulfate permease [Sulfuritalea sp.]MBP6636190.1 sulfate permease [Sulfuritalea sp.]